MNDFSGKWQSRSFSTIVVHAQPRACFDLRPSVWLLPSIVLASTLYFRIAEKERCLEHDFQRMKVVSVALCLLKVSNMQNLYGIR